MELQTPSMELPVEGPIRVYTPKIPGQREWVFDLIGWRAQLGGDPDREGGMVMHRKYFPVMMAKLIERFGSVDLYRQYKPEEACTSSCRHAKKADCSCSCAGEHHGARSGFSWLDGHVADQYQTFGTGEDDWSHTTVFHPDSVT